jgi:hypothetical protein
MALEIPPNLDPDDIPKIDGLLAFQLWLICVLAFADYVLAITGHPEWFGAQ